MVATVLSLIVVSMIGIGLDLVVRNRIQAEVFGQTQRFATQWIGEMRSGGVMLPPRDPMAGRVLLLQVVNPRGRVVVSSAAVSGRPPLSSVRPADDDRIRHLTECPSRGECVMLTAIRVSPQEAREVWHGESQVVYVGMAEPFILTAYRLELLIAAGALAFVAFAAGATWYVVGRTLRPVTAIRSSMSEITVSDLSLRVPQPPGQDEIALLARTSNQTLDRLEGAMRQQREFASDTSHELRTPIAGLRMQLEEALLYRDDVDPHETIRSALSVTDRLGAIVNDLLVLARLRAADPAQSETVNLTALVTEEASTPAGGMPVHARCAQDVKVRGNRIQLTRVLGNLLANAQRHADTAVEVTLERLDGEAVVTVSDDGQGIAPQDRERVFERFTRLEGGRRRDADGSGLGLPIAREITHAHHGTLRVEESPRGARFVLRLPLLDAGPSSR